MTRPSHRHTVRTLYFALALVSPASIVGCDDPAEREDYYVSASYPSAQASPGGAIGPDASDADGGTADTGDTSVPDVPDTAVTPDSIVPGDTTVTTDTATDTTVTTDTADTTGDTSPDVGPEPPDPTPPTRPGLDAAAKTALASSIESARSVGALNGHSFGGAVIDIETGELVYGSRADALMIPASNTKVVTTAAAIALLGEDYRLLTRVFAPALPDANGRVTSLAIHSAHDFSWSRWFYQSPREPLDVLADRLWQSGLRRVDGPIEVWGAYCYEGHNLGTYDPASHRVTAAARFRDALVARGIALGPNTNQNASMALPSGTELARFESQPLHVLLWAINRISHNEMADILLRHIGYAKGTDSSYAAGSKVVLDWLASEGLDTTGMVMNDGSGLATTNRFSARQLAGLYRIMADHPTGPAWRTSLSIGGGEGPGSSAGGVIAVTTNTAPYMGTLGYRMTAADIAGRVYGKSGTNAGITTTGLLVNRYDHREYAFAFMMNGITSAAYPSARTSQDNMVAASGKKLRGTATPPSAPTLLTAELTSNYRVRITWTPVAGVTGQAGRDGYFVHLSADGRRFPGERRRHTTSTSIELPALAVGESVHVQVSAVTQGGESPRSSVLTAARGDANASHVLVVDGNDRWQREPTNENPMGAPHAFIAREAEAMVGVHIDSAANESLSAAMLARYDAVVFAVGEESAGDETFTPAEQIVFADYLESGGALLVSGAEVAWDLDPRGNTSATASDRQFLEGWLKSGYGSDDANTFVAGLDPSGPLFAPGLDLDRIDFYTPGQMFVAFPEVLTALDGGTPILRYSTNTIAGVAWSGPFRVVHLGFPLASVSDTARRTRLATRLLGFLLP